VWAENQRIWQQTEILDEHHRQTQVLLSSKKRKS